MRLTTLQVLVSVALFTCITSGLHAQLLDVSEKFYVCEPKAVLYKKQSGDSVLKVRLRAGDSLMLIEESYSPYIPPAGTQRFHIAVWHSGKRHTGWMEGRDFGRGVEADLDTNGIPETLVAARYLDYIPEESYSDTNNAEVLLIQKGAVVSRYSFLSFGHFRWLKFKPTGLPGLPEAWLMFNGYYMDFGVNLFYWNGREIKRFQQYRGYGSEGSSHEIEFIFPVSPI